ncbi:hypothetical protein PV797_17020 [Clostridiaceae bacterium M8S5]|nr:hypothetical protein PV797_17020 [Clostridiaceae bacterium M8S5]
MKIKKILVVVSCFLATVIIYLYICIIVTPKSIDDFGGANLFRGMGFIAEPKNTIDVMICGNSDVYAGIIPALMYEKFGYTSYASGKAMQTIEGINRIMRRLLRNQKPKVVILEVDCLYEKNKYSMDNTNFYYAPFVYHARWKELKVRDFYTFPRRAKKYDISKGFVFSNEVYVNKPIDYMGDKNSKPLPIPKVNMDRLNHFISACRTNNIKIVFLELPSSYSWDYSKSNFIQKIADKEEIPFIDLNIANKQYKVDMTKDFRDDGNHMNVYGAQKATMYVGKYLAKNYKSLLKDNRNNKNLNYWNEVVNHYKQQLNKGFLKLNRNN